MHRRNPPPSTSGAMSPVSRSEPRLDSNDQHYIMSERRTQQNFPVVNQEEYLKNVSSSPGGIYSSVEHNTAVNASQALLGGNVNSNLIMNNSNRMENIDYLNNSLSAIRLQQIESSHMSHEQSSYRPDYSYSSHNKYESNKPHGSDHTFSSPSSYLSNMYQGSPQRALLDVSTGKDLEAQLHGSKQWIDDHLPNPVSAMYGKFNDTCKIFTTNIKGKVLPPVTTDFITLDEGNSGPRFIRSTIYNVPKTMTMIKECALPFGVVISPFAKSKEGEVLPPIRDTDGLGPLRCNRCKAYMCPYMHIMDNGRIFYCVFCDSKTVVPEKYFNYLNFGGQHEKFGYPDLVLGTYDFIATKEYFENEVEQLPPAFIFVIDVSFYNIQSGLVHFLCSQMKNILHHLPKDVNCDKSVVRVGFITYDSSVHFYNIKGTLIEPKMLVVSDLNDMFVPSPNGLLSDLEESGILIDYLMEQIPKTFAGTRCTGSSLAPAVQAGLEILKSASCAGKLFVFHSSPPTSNTPGKSNSRESRNLLGTQEEKSVLTAQTKLYRNLAEECVNAGCSVDLFIFYDLYVDLATIGDIAKYTGGEVYKYCYFKAESDGQRLLSDISQDVSQSVAFDAIMRIRTSLGIQPVNYYGHYFMWNVTEVHLAGVNCDKAVAVELKYNDDITEDAVYIQTAVLYTSCGGQRRIRILNLALNTCTAYSDVFNNCEMHTLVNFLSKQAVSNILTSNSHTVKKNLIKICVDALACYRKNIVGRDSWSQLHLPHTLNLLPLYISCIIKSDAVSGRTDIFLDDYWFNMQVVNIMDVPSSVWYFYPRLIPIHDIDLDSDEIPMPVRCSYKRMHSEGAYLLENGVCMFMWIGLSIRREWVYKVFNVPSVAQIDSDQVRLIKLENPLSKRIRSLIYQLNAQNRRSMKLTVIRERDQMETVFKHFLVEDHTNDTASYLEFMTYVHNGIRKHFFG